MRPENDTSNVFYWLAISTVKRTARALNWRSMRKVRMMTYRLNGSDDDGTAL